MVVVIVGIVAAVVIPNAINTSDLQVMSAARILTADLQYAQDTAITSQTAVSVVLQPASETYQLSNTSGALIHPITKDVYTVDFTSLRGFGEVDVVSASFNGASSVTFDELGTPNAGGTVVLRAGPHVYTISVAAITGTVTVTRS
ncbi:MAG: GspH/FimT family protein [Phycisphaerae bacterium]|nr:GspH/FimT family protein [Phycisphaerae bacterium]